MSILYDHYGDPPIDIYVQSIVPSYLGLRVNFSGEMENNDALINPFNYLITKQEFNSVTCSVVDVTPEGVTYPTYVDLNVSDLTNGKQYLFSVVPNTIQDRYGSYIVSGSNILYDGISDSPIIQNVTSLSSTFMEVTFSKSMNLDDISDVNNYSFDKGLSIISVTVISSSVVRLLTTTQTPSELYTLTVT